MNPDRKRSRSNSYSRSRSPSPVRDSSPAIRMAERNHYSSSRPMGETKRYRPNDNPTSTIVIKTRIKEDGAYFLEMKPWYITGKYIKPAEVSLRWTNGLRSEGWMWFIRWTDTQPTDAQLNSYSRTQYHCCLSKEEINVLPDATDQNHTLNEMDQILMQHPNDPIFIVHEQVKKWIPNQRWFPRVTKFTEKNPATDFFSVVDHGKEKKFDMDEICKQLALDGRCYLHRDKAPRYQCAHQDSLGIQQTWLMYKMFTNNNA